MDATVTWKHGLRFRGVGGSTGFPVELASKPENGHAPEGAGPLELLLLGTAGCTAMDVISILEKKRQKVTAFEVRMHADRADEHPRVFTHITMEYVITGHAVDPEAVKRAIDLSVEKYCSAHAMMSKAVPIEHTFTIIETERQGV
ncbi:MAG: OsmC family protein [Chloroflexi bacterium]|nr:OsmC family protein [Chloroflexota bacterium]